MDMIHSLNAELTISRTPPIPPVHFPFWEVGSNLDHDSLSTKFIAQCLCVYNVENWSVEEILLGVGGVADKESQLDGVTRNQTVYEKVWLMIWLTEDLSIQ